MPRSTTVARDGSNCLADGIGVRPADPAGVRSEALVPNGTQILRVRVEDVLPANLAGGVEEREPDADGDLEQAPVLAVRLGDESGVHGVELLRGRKAAGIASQVGERLLERLDLEWRDVDQARGRSACTLERSEEGVDRGQSCIVGDDAGCLQLGDERVEVHPRPVRDVGRRGQEPERGEAEGGDRSDLDDVSRGLADCELPGGRLDLAGSQLPGARPRPRARP